MASASTFRPTLVTLANDPATILSTKRPVDTEAIGKCEATLTNPSSSIFRRRIIADAAEGVVRAGIEDDFHHYHLTFAYSNDRIDTVTALSVRTPFDICCEAEARLTRLIGHKIATRCTDLPDPHQQCTHMFETAVVALAQAVRGGCRQYDIAVPHRELGGMTTASLLRDGEPALEWTLQGDVVVSPGLFEGRNVRTLLAWVEANCDDEMLEAVRVLRRGVHVSSGRSVPYEEITQDYMLERVRGACYVFQPGQIERAVRAPDDRRDFSHTAHAMLADFHPQER